MLFFGKYLQKRGLIATPLCHISLVLHINVFFLLFCCAESRINWKRKTIKNWKIVLIFDNLQTAVYNAERSVIQWNFFGLKNPRFIIESGFKSRAGYNDTRRVGKLNAAYLKSLFNNTQAGARSFHFDKFVNLSKWHLRETLFVRLRHSKAFKVVIR